MTLEDFEKILHKLDSIQQIFGIGGAILLLIILIGGFLLWKFLIKRIEKIAEEITDKNLRTFQSKLDKGLVKFSSKHQKQVDAVQV